MGLSLLDMQLPLEILFSAIRHNVGIMVVRARQISDTFTVIIEIIRNTIGYNMLKSLI